MILIVLCAILLVGCSIHTNPKEDYRMLLAKSQNLTEYKAIYNVAYGRLSSNSGVVELFLDSKKDNNMKVGMSHNTMDVNFTHGSIVYTLGNEIVYCIGNFSCLTKADVYDEGIFLNRYDAIIYDDSIIQQLRITEGKMEIVKGRTCRDFSIYVDDIYQVYKDNKYYNPPNVGYPPEKFSGRYDVCMDEATGLMLKLKLIAKPEFKSYIGYDFVSGRENVTIYTTNDSSYLDLKIISLNDTVDDSEFVPVTPFHIKKAICNGLNKFYANIEFFIDYDGQLATGYHTRQFEKNISVNFKAFESKWVKIGESNSPIKDYSQPYKEPVWICINDTCTPGYCSQDQCNGNGNTSREKCANYSACVYKNDLCQRADLAMVDI